MRVSLELQAEAAIKLLDSIEGRAINMQPASEQILADLRQLAGRQFATSGAARGPAWAPLKPSTVREKLRSQNARVRSNASRTLIATGEMRRSLTSKNAGRATNDEISYGSPLKRAKYHHRGTRTLPARPLIRLDDRDTKRHARIILAHLTQAQDSISRRTRGESA